MKAHFVTTLSALLFISACGSSSTTAENTPTRPPLPFSQVATTLPLTSGPLADHLIYADDIDPNQVQTLRTDLAVIDSWPGVMTAAERLSMQNLLGLANGTPAELSVWFKERMKYILASSVGAYDLGLVFGPDREVGLQELGTDESEDESNTGGGNIGTAIYLTTLEEQRSRSNLSYLILRINDKWVPITSPRVGLMRIGPALFANQFQVNQTNIRALSNSLQRLEVLFHEARHSDGNVLSGSVGFSHINCPNDGSIPGELVGVPACDDTSNGAYSVGAAVLKPLLHLCEGRCTTQEKEILKAIHLDRLSRVTPGASGVLKTLDPTPETSFNTINISDFGAFNLR